MRRLLIRPGGIGDCILCFPVMEFLRASYTEVWTTSAVTPLIGFADRVRSIASTGLDLVGLGELPIASSLREQIAGFDHIVSWYGAARQEFRSALTAIQPNCTFLRALPPPEFNGHAGEFFAQQVSAPRLPPPHIEVTRSHPRDTLVIHPFSGGRAKNWPLLYFQEVAQAFPQRVEWTAGPEEQLPRAHCFTDLLQLASWLTGARAYLGNDSGITHLAAAVHVPVLALFGPTNPAVWAPRNAMVMRSESLSELRPNVVLDRLRQLLETFASTEESDSAPL